MKTTKVHAIVLVTSPDRKTARRLARAALTQRLAACANLLSGAESHYWWQGKLEHGREVLMLFKTRRSCLPALEALILAQHPYDTPEFITLDIRAGTERYLGWIDESVRSEAEGRPQSRSRKTAPRRTAPVHE